MAITVLTDGSVAVNTRTLSWTIPSLTSGDIVVVGGQTWDPGDAQLNNPSGTGLAFGSPRVVRTTAAKVYQAMWAMAATASGTNVVVTCSQTTATANMHTGVLWVLPAADGYSLAGTPNTASILTSGANQVPQGTLTGAAGNVGLGMIGDWNGNTLSGRTYAGSATEDMASINDSTQVYFHQTLTVTSNTIGLTSPSIATASWDVMGIEVLATGDECGPDGCAI